MNNSVFHFSSISGKFGIITMCGDSIVNGYGLAEEDTWRVRTIKHLRDLGVRCTVHNGGHNGQKTADMLTNFSTDVTNVYDDTGLFCPAHPAARAIAVLAAGSNDAATNVDEATARSNQNTWLGNAKTLGYYVGTSDVLARNQTFSGGADVTSFETWRAANNAYRASQVGSNQDFISQAAADSRLSNPSDTTYFQDGIHPTAAGADILAQYLAEAIASFIALL